MIDNPTNINNNKHLKLFIIHFGICKVFWNFNTNKHVDKVQHKWDEDSDTMPPFEGTYRFSSQCPDYMYLYK